jgi:hypothetical protein
MMGKMILWMPKLFAWSKRVQAASFALAIFSVVSAQAKQQAAESKDASTVTGSVTGYVECDETELPARFAEIRLVPRPVDTDQVQVGEKVIAPDVQPVHLSMVTGFSDMDGRFRIDGVPAGDYFAGALMSGYVMSGTGAGADAKGDELKQLIASLPAVHVTAGQVASVKLTLHRGAVIAGKVEFADGSPAIGVRVGFEGAEKNLALESVRLARPSAGQEIMRQFDYNTNHRPEVSTDDEGHYRIFGLPPGKYIVNTVIVSQLGSGQISMSDGSGSRTSGKGRIYPNVTAVYGPGVFRRKDAKVFELHDEEQVTNADVKLDPSGLHTVKGKILEGEDHHVPSQAMLRLLEGETDAGQFSMMENDGSFQFDYVPSGSYTLLVTGSPDMTTPTGPTDFPQLLRQYKQLEAPLIVGEHDVVLDDLVLIALKPGETEKWR